MKNIPAVLIYLLIHVIATGQSTPQSDKLKTRVLSANEMREDFKFLRKILEETHPGLYRYTPKEVMQKKMDSLQNLLTSEMPFYDFYRHLCALNTEIRCAHTYIIPKQDLRQYFGEEVKMLPFDVIPFNNRLYIALNGTKDTVIRPGYEILSINGKSTADIISDLYGHLWTDGYIESSKRSLLLGTKFGMFYYAMIERPDSFLVKLRNLKQQIIEMKVAALPHAAINNELLNNPVNKKIVSLYKEKNEYDMKNPWRLEMLDKPRTALLRISGFGGGSNGEEAAKKMRDFMEKTIDELNKKDIKNLVVDIRHNGGGWDIQGVELFTYLMKDSTPVRYYRRKHSITDSTEFLKFSDLSPEDLANVKNELIPEADGTFTIKEEYNDDLKLQYPKPKRFTGNIYFLINGSTGSTAAEFVAVAHSNRLGIFIGEESGGAYEGGNGGSFLHFQLPNSGISVGTPLLYYQNGVTIPRQKGRGVIPDHVVPSTIEAFLNGTDLQMQYTLKVIEN